MLEAKAASAGESLFERNIRVLRLELEGAIAQADEHPDEAVAKLQAAAQLERDTPKHAVTPGPTLPSEELLAQAYLADGQRAQAHGAYERALARYPNRRNAVRGIETTASE